MVRVRKLVLAIAAASALSSGMAHALGLGEVTLQSALNQPLVAEIELLEVRDLSTNEVIPNLASPEEFNKAGVDRQYFLTDLKFTPVLKPNGKSVIRVTSSKPVREPYLNFLVEVLWPNGRLLREYTLLLDPPLYAPSTPAVAPQLPVASSAPRPAATPAPRPAAPATQSSGASRPAPASLSGNEYRTSSNDTLWDIAQRVPGGSVHQAMLAIQDLNPDAFVGGNINRLKSGQVLRLPDEQQVRSRSQSEAIAQVAAQNTAWREGRSVAAGTRQLDATKRDTAGAAPARVESKDSLRLVSGDTGKAAAKGDKGTGGDSKALADKLAVTQESLDSTRRENEELKSRMEDLQSQLEKLQRLIQLKDDQLAKMQADLANQGKAGAGGADEPKPEAAAPASPEQSAPPAAEAPATPPTPAAPDYNYSEEPAAEPGAAPQTNVQQPASEPADAVKPPASAPSAQPAKPTPATPAPKPVVEEPQPTSFIDDLLGNPMLLGIIGGGALLLLLVGLMVLSRRNAMKEAELQNSLSLNEEGDNAFDSESELPENSFADLEADLERSPVAQAQPEERVTAQTSDALGEADIYIAYGRFNQAAELLQNAINDEPHRKDLRLKLMEVYAELGDREGFARQENELREIGGAGQEVEQLKAKYPAMVALAGGMAAAAAADDFDSFDLDDLTLDEPAQAAAPATQGNLDDAFDLSLDDLEADLERDLKSSAAPAPVSDDLGLDDLSLDSDLDFGLDTAPAASTSHESLDFGLDFADEPASGTALGLGDDLADFSLDLDEESKAPAIEEDDFLLSLDDEPAVASAGPSVELPTLELPEEKAASEFDLPADFDLSVADEAPAAAKPEADDFAAQLDEVNAELEAFADSLEPQADVGEPVKPAASTPNVADLDADDDFDFLAGTDETATKLDLARAYIDMGDAEGARDILDEVISEGSDIQQQEARELLARLA
ncbi:FimV/HubP family polar landmark protein [Pseudomonas indica]|uniref:FimV/HubP family polar landmark protein n=1 Tax=Pseudomonas indica TaxID=137658 RepID=UPI000BABF57D|nr:FimV/HubP family polar landmark protein [Pseudomonas indica]MBU3057344.1 LysM peptidoglycan-binding domain-containing protein [Pseudomonas indica]PAU55940.1 peptigoglycan-binding protein LysM [Pseudomonas indica]